MTAIEITDLEKHFGPVRALQGISATIPGGTLTLVSGPNGAGKSTLLRILAGLTRPTRGAVRVLGRDPFRRESAPHRGEVGYLSAEPGLYGDLTLRENLEFCARLHALGPDRVGQIIESLELEPISARRVRTLSLGFRRRCGLARALLTDPELLLLDEPWNGLDRDASRKLNELLGRYRQKGRTALVVAHAPAEGKELFDAELHLSDGVQLAHTPFEHP
ncbi:MAG: ATP-binding cassette domain-containing protein [Myxococcota bacterium]